MGLLTITPRNHGSIVETIPVGRWLLRANNVVKFISVILPRNKFMTGQRWPCMYASNTINYGPGGRSATVEILHPLVVEGGRHTLNMHYLPE